MKKVVIILSLFSLINCCAKKEKLNIKIDPPSDTVMYERDKKQISDCFINKVEYFRKYYNVSLVIFVNSPDSLKKKHYDYYAKYPGADLDPSNFFEPYSVRYNLKDKYIPSQMPTNQEIEVKTDAILYNKNQLLCFAFLVIKSNRIKVEGLMDAREKGREYDAKAIIGVRKTKEEPFEIYPVDKFDVVGFEAYDTAVEQLKTLYFTKLKGDYTAGTQYTDENKFNSNVGDKDFFEKSPYFKKTKEGLYYFQIYKELEGNLKEYQYQKCN